MLLHDQGNRTTPLGTGASVMEKLDGLERKEKKRTCRNRCVGQINRTGIKRSHWARQSTRLASSNRNIPVVYAMYRKHWRDLSHLSHLSHAGGREGRSRWCQRSGKGHRSLAGFHYMSCRSGENSDLQRALGTVSLVVDIGRGEPEDNGKQEGRAGKRK